MKTSIKSRPPAGLPPVVIKKLITANHAIVGKQKAIATYTELIKIKQDRKERELALRPLLLNIGMVLSILLSILAINWKSYEDGQLVDLGKLEVDANEIIEIPISKQPPPPPPKQEVFKIAEVKDTQIIEEIELNLDVEVTAEEAIEEIDIAAPVEEAEVVDEIFVIVEQEPLPVGGIEAFYAYLASELSYPPTAMRLGISGAVYVQFVIEKDGSLTGVEVVKGIGAGCDEEAVRVIKNAAPWNPGKQRGLPVRVKKVLPVRFILTQR